MNKNGLFINKKEHALDQVKLDNSALKLLASGDGVEFMHQTMNANLTFDVSPPEDDSSLMEFFYILEGEISYFPGENQEKVILRAGDYFYTKSLKSSCVFRTLTKTDLIYVSTQPIFHFLGESLSELHRFNKEIGRKDKYTHGHSERVRDIAVNIAIEMGLNRDKIAHVSVAALFHDVGKIDIDNEILVKPSQLTEEEFEIIKKHPENGAKHVKKIKYMDVSDIVLQHHERIDGSGYPRGLKGNEICTEARIVAVADAFDSMTTDRPYQKAIKPKNAIEYMKKLAGTLYDAEAIDTLIKILKKDKVI